MFEIYSKKAVEYRSFKAWGTVGRNLRACLKNGDLQYDVSSQPITFKKRRGREIPHEGSHVKVLIATV